MQVHELQQQCRQLQLRAKEQGEALALAQCENDKLRRLHAETVTAHRDALRERAQERERVRQQA
ncbi:MAG: hypothetical protein ACK4ZJ_19760, partial [Allorhizobium sp.]